MITSVHTFRRLASATGLAALIVAVAIPVAFAAGNSPVLLDGRSPDTRDAAVKAQMQGLDPAIATAMRSNQSSLTAVERRSTDTLDVAIATAIAAHQSQTLSNLPSPVAAAARTEGSDWGNLVLVVAAIGAGFLLVGIGGHAAVTRNGRSRSTGSVRAA